MKFKKYYYIIDVNLLSLHVMQEMNKKRQPVSQQEHRQQNELYHTR